MVWRYCTNMWPYTCTNATYLVTQIHLNFTNKKCYCIDSLCLQAHLKECYAIFVLIWMRCYIISPIYAQSVHPCLFWLYLILQYFDDIKLPPWLCVADGASNFVIICLLNGQVFKSFIAVYIQTFKCTRSRQSTGRINFFQQQKEVRYRNNLYLLFIYFLLNFKINMWCWTIQMSFPSVFTCNFQDLWRIVKVCVVMF